MSALTANDRARAVAMIERPAQWPMWPLLPLKKHCGDFTDAGYCVTADFPTIVLNQFPSTKGVLLQLAIEDELPSLCISEATRKAYENAVMCRYDDIDQMLDAGWVID